MSRLVSRRTSIAAAALKRHVLNGGWVEVGTDKTCWSGSVKGLPSNMGRGELERAAGQAWLRAFRDGWDMELQSRANQVGAAQAFAEREAEDAYYLRSMRVYMGLEGSDDES